MQEPKKGSNAMTTRSSTATVETLTAQVHVLQVGNRQITLSVAKQLDRRRYDAIEPMGRIRTGRTTPAPSQYEDNEVEVIGRDLTTNALCFAYAPKGLWPRPRNDWMHWCYHQVMLGNLNIDDRFRATDCFDKAVWWRVEAEWSYCPVLQEKQISGYLNGTVEEKRGDLCDLEDLRFESTCAAAHDALLYERLETMNQQARELPLIVLAGLK